MVVSPVPAQDETNATSSSCSYYYGSSRTHEGTALADFPNSCLTFFNGMPIRMNGISAQYKIVGMFDR
jgi:hypothetical protein